MMNVLPLNTGIACVMVLTLSACGGGYGEHLSPKVVSNKGGITRAPIVAGLDYHLLEFPEYPDSEAERRKSVTSYGGWINSPFYHVHPIDFQNRRLEIALLSNENALEVLSDGGSIKRILLPRYGIMTRALVWESNEASFLVVYVNLQKTSNASVLLILNGSMETIYMEYLTGAKAVGRGYSKEIGSFIVVKSNGIFVHPETGERSRIEGDWMFQHRGEGVSPMK